MFDKKSYEDFLNEISKNPDEQFIEFQKRIIPGAGKVYGIRMGELRKLGKKLSPDYFEMKRYFSDSFEERMLLGLALAYSSIEDEQFFAEARELSKIFKTWAEVDCFCNTVKRRQGLYEFALELCKEEYVFTVRMGVILLMNLYLDDEHISHVLASYASIKSEEYYVQMGIAWALSVAYIHYRDEVFHMLRCGKFDVDTTIKAIRKCLESYRIPKEEKEKLRKLRGQIKEKK